MAPSASVAPYAYAAAALARIRRYLPCSPSSVRLRHGGDGRPACRTPRHLGFAGPSLDHPSSSCVVARPHLPPSSCRLGLVDVIPHARQDKRGRRLNSCALMRRGLQNVDRREAIDLHHIPTPLACGGNDARTGVASGVRAIGFASSGRTRSGHGGTRQERAGHRTTSLLRPRSHRHRSRRRQSTSTTTGTRPRGRQPAR
jgi:hypothetical protein